MRPRNYCEAEFLAEGSDTAKSTKGFVDDGDEFATDLAGRSDDLLDLGLHYIANDGDNLGFDYTNYL